MKDDGKLGLDHFFQSIILLFIKKYNDELGKFAPTFLKKLMDVNCISESYILGWYNEDTVTLDKKSMLYSKKSQRKFREMLEEKGFINWLETAEAEVKEMHTAEKKAEGDDSDEDDKQITDSKPAETEQQKKRREAIEKQQKQ